MSASRIPPGQYGGFVSWFNRTAVNGRIGRRELRSVLTRLGRDPSHSELTKIIDSISVDPDGITFQAFINYVGQYQQLRNVDTEYREAFRIYDKSGTGFLSKSDISYVFDKLRIKMDVDELFRQVDIDNSGTIDYSEFVAAMGKTL